LNETRWTVSNKATSIRAAVMGLGYAWFPEDSVREEVEAGTLKPLPLKEGAERYGTLYLVLANGDAAGPGARELAGIIGRRVRDSCPAHAPSMPATGKAAGRPTGTAAAAKRARATA